MRAVRISIGGAEEGDTIVEGDMRVRWRYVQGRLRIVLVSGVFDWLVGEGLDTEVVIAPVPAAPSLMFFFLCLLVGAFPDSSEPLCGFLGLASATS